MTIIIRITDGGSNEEIINVAAHLIRRGEVVIFPTETVYGIGADALNPSAVRRVFELKGRPPDNPLIVHISNKEQLRALTTHVSEKAKALVERFWPGPLTLVLPRSRRVPDVVTGGMDTVAVRMPDHPVALKLIERSGRPIAAPSANISGRPSPTLVEHVVDDFYGLVDCIIDGGPTDIGVESTVVDMSGETPVLLRPGGLPLETIKEVVGRVEVHPAVRGGTVDNARSPGMKYKHYSPNAMVLVVEGSGKREKIERLVKEYRDKGLKVGVMARERYEADEVYLLGEDVKEVAKNIFKALRYLDKRGVDVIIAEGVDERGLGLAVMNRLRKAAGYRIIR